MRIQDGLGAFGIIGDIVGGGFLGKASDLQRSGLSRFYLLFAESDLHTTRVHLH